jgi:hypothetical protein
VKQPLNLGKEPGERLGGGAIERRWDEGLVEDDLLVGADLGDAGKAETDEPGPIRAFRDEAQAQLADLDIGGGARRAARIADLLLVNGKASGALRCVLRRGFRRAGLITRQSVLDDAVPRVLGNLQRDWVVRLVGDRERRSIFEDAPRLEDREFAEAQHVAIELQLGEAPGKRAQRRDAAAHQLLDIAVRLLEMLRPQEQAFRPDDLIVP